MQQIVIIPIGLYEDGRHIANNIEGQSFSGINALKEFINSNDEEKTTNEQIALYSLSDFMEVCNNEEIDLSFYWISYINYTETKEK